MVDADWVGDKSGRALISGFIWSYGEGPISWSAKKQNCMALSLTEVEYVALTQALQEGIWLRNSLTPADGGTLSLVPCHFNGALSLASNNSSHGRAKHIDI